MFAGATSKTAGRCRKRIDEVRAWNFAGRTRFLDPEERKYLQWLVVVGTDAENAPPHWSEEPLRLERSAAIQADPADTNLTHADGIDRL